MGHIPQGRASGFDLLCQSSEPGSYPLFELFLASLRHRPRHVMQINGS